MLKTTSLNCVAALLLVLLSAHGVRAQQSAAVTPPLISVTGEAEVLVVPDEVVFKLVVAKMDKDLSVAKAQNDESVRKILALARRFKVAPQDVKTDYISVDMRYSTDIVEDEDDEKVKKVKREFVGYNVSKTIIIRFTDIAHFEDFFSEVLSAGISSVDDVDFRTSQIRKHKDAARAQAIRAAKEKATALTAAIGQTIGRAYSIEEEGNERSSSFANTTTRVSGNFDSSESSTIAPGMIRVSARVSVSFLLN